MLALMWIAHHIKSNGRRLELGYTAGKASTALGYIYGYRRVMLDYGRFLSDMREVDKFLKGLNAEYMAEWGQDSLISHQCLTLSHAHLRAINAACTMRSVPGFFSRAARHLARAQRLRDGHGRAQERRRQRPLRQASQLRLVGPGPQAAPCVSGGHGLPKNRRLPAGILRSVEVRQVQHRVGGKPQWFRLDSSNPLNFAFRWQQHELAYPCPEGLRSSWPAFSPSGDDIPYSSASLSAECSRLFAASLGAADADGRTFHSWRARLASALGAARAAGDRSIDDSVIQALAHWKTVASVHRYIRMRPEDYARFVDIASSTNAGMQVRTDLPDIDPGRAMAEVMQASGLIERGLGGPVGATAVARPGPDKAARNPDPPVPRARRAGVRQDAASSSASHPDLPVPRARRAAAWQDTASSSTGNPADQPARPTEEAPAARFDLGDGSIGIDAGSDPLGLVGTS